MPPDTTCVTTAPIGNASLQSLIGAVKHAKSTDPFARVVVVTDHSDVARAVRHHLGSSGTINVTVQVGHRLAAELAEPILRSAGVSGSALRRPLSRLLESQAVRDAAQSWSASDISHLSDTGRRRFYDALATTFRQMAERPAGYSPEPPPAVPFEAASSGAVSSAIEGLFQGYVKSLRDNGFYTRSQLPDMAVEALTSQESIAPDQSNGEPSVIYYLPRRLSEGELRLAQKLLERGQCQVILGVTGDPAADLPFLRLLEKLHPAAAAPGQVPDPLSQRAASDSLSVVIAPDPGEEVRMVIRQIVGATDEMPFHEIAVIHRQDLPYASLLRQELDFAGIPHTGVPYHRLADTPPGRFLRGMIDLAMGVADADPPTVDRDRLINWLNSTGVTDGLPLPPNHHPGSTATVPAARWATLARESRANGTLQGWKSRLNAHLDRLQRRLVEQDTSANDDAPVAEHPWLMRERSQTDALLQFIDRLCQRLADLGAPPQPQWDSAIDLVRGIIRDFQWPTPGDESHRQRMDDLLADIADLQQWGSPYGVPTLRDAVVQALQSPTSDRGRPVGDGIYVGPPSGIVGAAYQAIFAVGMVERQFPPTPRVNPWLSNLASTFQLDEALERYDFLGAIASAQRAVLSYPTAGTGRNATYPSRWLIEAANLIHRAGGNVERLSHENLAHRAEIKPWLTVVPSREAGLARLISHPSPTSPGSYQPARIDAADPMDYDLSYLAAYVRQWPRPHLSAHPALFSNQRLLTALVARDARRASTYSRWDGLVGAGLTDLTGRIGTQEYPVSASALERWARCPFQFFASRILRLEAPPMEESDEISALDRGSLVHTILERYAAAPVPTLDELLAIAEQEFAAAEQQGATGYYLLWEIEKENMRDSLKRFMDAEVDWFPDADPAKSAAEIAFGPHAQWQDVSVLAAGVGPVWFRGKIDRIDVGDEEVRVRDFKTGSPDSYRARGANAIPQNSVSNGRALQLPIYLAAAKTAHPDLPVTASYCFPLHDPATYDVAEYSDTDEEMRDAFHHALTTIVGSVRQGIFPATPDGKGSHGNCGWCDFRQLCPTRRRYIWLNKGRRDPTVQGFNDLGGDAAV